MIYYLISVFLKPGKLEILRQYEQHAAPIMAKHGGHFERIFRPIPIEGNETPDEIHLLSFDHEEGFSRFHADPEFGQFKNLREEAVLKATVLPLRDYALADYFSQ